MSALKPQDEARRSSSLRSIDSSGGKVMQNVLKSRTKRGSTSLRPGTIAAMNWMSLMYLMVRSCEWIG